MKLESGQFIDHSRKLLKVSGLDAKKFLQGIITNDINKSFSSLIYSGLLSPQGKYLFDFFINGLDEENFIICLLYTSPSPRDPKTSRMPSSA